MLKNTLRVSIILLLMATALTSFGQPSTLEQCVKDCKFALDKADKHIENIETTNLKQQLMIKFLDKQLMDSRAALDKELDERYQWYKNPAITITMGLALGVLTGVIVSDR